MASTLRQARRVDGAALSVEEVIDVLAYLIGRLGPMTRSVGGSIAFSIEGDGCWTVDLEQSGGRWKHQQEVPAASTVVRASRESFPAVLLAPHQVPALLQKRALVVEGDRSKFVRLADLMEVGGGMVAMRARQSGGKRRS